LGYNGFMKNTNTYPIRHVAQKTGLTPHLIRAWERRYGAVVPERTPSNRRLYSEEDIERLKLLRRAAGAGHSMAQIAGMSTEALSELMGGERAEPAGLSTSPKSESPAFHLGRCLTKVQQLDPAGLHEALNRAAIALNRTAIIEDVVSPLLRKIGDLWGEGTLKVANEHMATAVIRSFLGELLVSAYGSQSAPRIVVTTPPGEWHEIGPSCLLWRPQDWVGRPCTWGRTFPPRRSSQPLSRPMPRPSHSVWCRAQMIFISSANLRN